MKIVNLEEIDSTQNYLKEYISINGFTEPICVTSKMQTLGIGSRGNSWIGKEGNLFFSFVTAKNDLTYDLPLQSCSIYFSYILKKILTSYGSKLWLKWPNDFYLEDKKIGGTITSVNGNLIYCGIGLNLNFVDEAFGKLDIFVDKKQLLEEYFFIIDKKISWKDIFSDFKIEFQKSLEFSTTINNDKRPLFGAVLNEDGSIQINDEKVFSLR